MTDVHNKATRSFNMSQIKSRNTKPEMLVRKLLYANGFRYRVHVKNLPGKPDIVLSKYKTLIFVNGCFWHGHKNCLKAALPKTRSLWWKNKINKNVLNDKNALKLLKTKKWRVIVIWQCQMKNNWQEKLLQRFNTFL